MPPYATFAGSCAAQNRIPPAQGCARYRSQGRLSSWFVRLCVKSGRFVTSGQDAHADIANDPATIAALAAVAFPFAGAVPDLEGLLARDGVKFHITAHTVGVDGPDFSESAKAGQGGRRVECGHDGSFRVGDNPPEGAGNRREEVLGPGAAAPCM